MRNLHLHNRTEYDVESMKMFCHWERMELKIANFQNPRRFTLRCLSEKVMPVSVRHKSHIKTPKGFQIITRVERALLNERVRMINNSVNMLSTQRDTCKIKLKEKIGEEIMEECELFKTMNRQKRKLELFCQKISSEKGGHPSNIHSGNTLNLIPDRGDCSNQNINNNIILDHSDGQDMEGTQDTTTTANKWVINITDKPLTEAEEKLLTSGPNFVVVPRNPPIIQYVAAVEQACTKLEEGKSDEFRVQFKVIIQKIQKPKPNITKEERIALTKLKKDPSKMVLTADKEMVLVIMNTEDYKKKAEELLEQQHRYRSRASDPTMRLKNKLIFA